MPRHRRDPIYKETAPDKSKPKVLGADGQLHWQRMVLDGYYIRWTDASGKRHKVYAAPTRSQARDVYQQKMKEVADERAGIRRADMSKMRIQEILTSFLAARKRHVTEKQLGEIASSIRKTIKGTKSVWVADLTAARIEKYLDRLEGAGRAPRTVNRHLIFVRSMFNWAVDSELMPYSPVASVKPKPITEVSRQRRAMSLDEVRRLFEAARREKARPWELVSYALAYYVGLRREEIRKIRWADVDLEEGTLTVRPEIDKSRRGAVLPLSPPLRTILAERQRHRPGMPMAAVAGLPYKPLKSFYKTLTAAGIERVDATGKVVDLHAIRHTYGTHLVQAGVDIKTVQKLMRHSKAETTLAFYIHSDARRRQEAIARLPDFSAVESAAKEATTGERIGPEEHPSDRKRVPGTLNERSLPVRIGANRCDLPHPTGDGPEPEPVREGMEVLALHAVRDYVELLRRGVVAGRRGLEPPTLGSTVRYSIQLS